MLAAPNILDLYLRGFYLCEGKPELSLPKQSTRKSHRKYPWVSAIELVFMYVVIYIGIHLSSKYPLTSIISRRRGAYHSVLWHVVRSPNGCIWRNGLTRRRHGRLGKNGLFNCRLLAARMQRMKLRPRDRCGDIATVAVALISTTTTANHRKETLAITGGQCTSFISTKFCPPILKPNLK